MSKTHCPQQHEYTPENTYIDKHGYRHCKICRRARMVSRREGKQVGHANSRKTHCPKNHPYDEENTIYTKDGRRQCRACAKANLAIQNTKRYGLTPEAVEEMLVRQAYRCLICVRKFGVQCGVPHIDHDHDCCPSGKSCGKCVRGLLCSDCNQGLGKFADDPYRLMAAADYLKSR